ncbi:hypothetical protein BKA66DRAFT_449564 [Pyrenochaeta sp. MPI-SDFR-AT-0127]|nr:hypothetical protein BKA66DRAFT_449564 [Pyrenochaeta sp. MPI-SDFR-AT-0127]
MRLTTLLALLSLLFSPTLARPWNTSDPCPDTIKTVVSHDPCRDSLNGPWCKNVPEFSSMDSVHAALVTCPNITALDLRVTLAGCSGWPDRWNFPFKHTAGEKYPPLKFLKLEGYEFGEVSHLSETEHDLKNALHNAASCVKNSWSNIWAREQPPSKGQHLKSNFGLWLDAMDWSGVEELGIVGYRYGVTGEVLEKLPPRLTALKRLEMTNVSFVRALSNNTLTHITWVGASKHGDLSSILAHQGESLESLEFRCEEISCPSFPAQLDISTLPKLAPNLKHLAINVPRNGTWPLESLTAIASLPHLRTADLYMNIQSPCVHQRPDRYSMRREEWMENDMWNNCKGEDQFHRPFLNESSALELYKLIGSQKAQALDEVTFWVGDWSRPWDGPIYIPPWIEGRRAKFTCKKEGMGEDEVRCEAKGDKEYWKHGGEGGQYWAMENEWDDDYDYEENIEL